MPTLNQLVDGVLAEVYSGTQTIDTSSHLSGSINASATSIAVGDASRFSAGIIEIGSELILVSSVNRDANTLTVGARGIRGTTAAAHSAGDRVIMAPAIGRYQVEQAITETLRATSLFAVDTTTVTFSAAERVYLLPAGVDHILSVTWNPDIMLTAEWIPVRRWTHDKVQGSVVIGDPLLPGRDVRVVYATDPAVPAFTSDFSATGLPDSAIDVIRFGAAWRVVSFLEPMNLLGNAAEAKANDRSNAAGQRQRVAQYYYQMFATRQQEELARLQNKYPIRVHFGGN